jgi:hypothetical protein
MDGRGQGKQLSKWREDVATWQLTTIDSHPGGKETRCWQGSRSRRIVIGICADAEQRNRMWCSIIRYRTWADQGSWMRQIVPGVYAGPVWGGSVKHVHLKIGDGGRKEHSTRHISTENYARA